MPTVDVNGITINYTVEGSETGDLIVLVNGLADDKQTWAAQIPAFLDAGFRILSFDNRGVGLTSRPDGPYTAELLADDLHGLLIALKIQEAHLVGVSMGGMILQSYALRYPNASGSSAAASAAAAGGGGRVEMLSLTLACTYAQPTEFCERMFTLWAEMAQKMSVQDVMRDVTLWAFTVPFFRTRTAELEEVERAMEELDVGLEEYLAQLNVIRKFDSTSALASLRADERWLGGLQPWRVLVLAGKTDILIPVTLSRELAERVEGSVFRTVKGGHGCMWEFPSDFNNAVIEHIEDCKSSSV